MAAQGILFAHHRLRGLSLALSRRGHLHHRLFSLERHPKRVRDEHAEQQCLRRQGLYGRIDADQRHGGWKIERRCWDPTGRLQLIDTRAGEDESHDVEQRAGDAKEIFERHAQAELENRKGRREHGDDARAEAEEDRVVAILVLQPERLIKKHHFEGLAVHCEERDADQAENAFARKYTLDFVLDERLPAPGFAARVQPVANIEKRHRGEDRYEALHAFAMLAAEREHCLGSEPSGHTGEKRKDPAEMDVADGVRRPHDSQHGDDRGENQRRLEAFAQNDQRRIQERIIAGEIAGLGQHLRGLVEPTLDLQPLLLNLLIGDALADRIAKLGELGLEGPSEGGIFGEERWLGHFEAVEVGLDRLLVGLFFVALAVERCRFAEQGTGDQ